MAKNKIAGLTIEIGGNTGPLNKALGEVNKKSKDLTTELKQVDRMLKLDPKNTELVAQKQKILAESIENTSEKLDKLKTAEKQAQDQFKRGEISEDQYRALQREVIKTEDELKKLTDTAKDLDKTLSNSLKNAGDKMQKFGGKVQGAGKAMAPVSAAAGAAVGGIIAMGVKAGQSADEINTLAKQTGLSTEEIQKFMYASERIDVPLETLTGSMAKLTKNMGMAKEGTGAAAEAFAELGVDVRDKVTGELRNNQDVFDETIQKLGELTNETERDSLAMEIFGRSAQNLNPLILGGADALKKMGEEAEKAGLILSQEALDDANEFNDAIDELKATATGSFAKLGAEIAKDLIPLIQDLAGFAKNLLKWFSNLDGGTVKLIMVVLALVAGLAPLLIVVGKIITAVGIITSALPALGAAFTALTGPIGIVIAAVVGIIAIGVALYKNWDTIKEKASQFAESISQIFTNIKNAISDKINAAKDAVKAAIDMIKGFFKFEWSLPKIKLPHFKFDGKFSLSPPSVPKLAVDWYKDGGIFDRPSIIGVGEAGTEAVIPLNQLSGILADAMNKSGGGVTEVVHSGTVRHEGINNRGELVAAINQDMAKTIANDDRRIPNRAKIIPIE